MKSVCVYVQVLRIDRNSQLIALSPYDAAEIAAQQNHANHHHAASHTADLSPQQHSPASPLHVGFHGNGGDDGNGEGGGGGPAGFVGAAMALVSSVLGGGGGLGTANTSNGAGPGPGGGGSPSYEAPSLLFLDAEMQVCVLLKGCRCFFLHHGDARTS